MLIDHVCYTLVRPPPPQLEGAAVFAVHTHGIYCIMQVSVWFIVTPISSSGIMVSEYGCVAFELALGSMGAQIGHSLDS